MTSDLRKCRRYLVQCIALHHSPAVYKAEEQLTWVLEQSALASNLHRTRLEIYFVSLYLD